MKVKVSVFEGGHELLKASWKTSCPLDLLLIKTLHCQSNDEVVRFQWRFVLHLNILHGTEGTAMVSYSE